MNSLKRPEQADPPLNPGYAARPRRWLGRSAALSVVVAATLTVTACGSDEAPPVVTLDTEKVERAIEQSTLDQRGTLAQVSCPSGVPQREGWEFSCTALAGRSSTKFVVTELDGSGNVHYEAP